MKNLRLAALALLVFANEANACAISDYKAGMEKMHRDMSITYSGDTDVDFAKGMVPHHQGAVDMANTVLKYGKDPEVRKLAEWILYTQKQEIAQMTHWLARREETPGAGSHSPASGGHHAHAPAKDASSAATKGFLEADAKMHKDMHIKYSGDADLDFVRGMIPHHQGAVEMAIVQKQYGKNAEMNRLADDIIRSQQQEIAQMKKWLEKREGNKRGDS